MVIVPSCLDPPRRVLGHRVQGATDIARGEAFEECEGDGFVLLCAHLRVDS